MTHVLDMTQDETGVAKRVSLYGTFDVLNYGDLLFPLLLRDRLGIAEEDFRAFSPKGGPLPWNDTILALPIDQAPHSPADLHVIGGGNIIHANATPLADYAGSRFGGRGSYAALWLGAGLIAAQSGARLVWNAPGLPRPLPPGPVQALSNAVLDASLMVTVRDEKSREFLSAPEQQPVSVMPDTVLDLAAMWPAASLRDVAESAFARHGMTTPVRWFALHVNDRYLDGDEALQVRQIEELARTLDALPVLIAIGPCHGDDQLARRIGQMLSISALILDQPDSLKEIAGLIAHAVCYVGSSMHGLITALAYDKPALVIARPHMVKFDGFLTQLGMSDRLVTSWEAALGRIDLLKPLGDSDRAAIATARQRIAEHWATLRGLMDQDVPERTVRAMAQLRAWMAQRVRPPQDWEAFMSVLPAVPVQSVPPQINAAFHCNICGGDSLRPERKLEDSLIGHGYICAGCNASARHRAMRGVLNVLRSDPALCASGLQYGRHRVAAGGWFKDFDLLEPAHDGAALVPPPAGKRYQMLLCLDMLEQVADPGAALAGLRGAMAQDGVLLLSFRTAPGRATTLDWGFPRGDDQGRLRTYGMDMIDRLADLLPGAHLSVVQPVDPYSGLETLLCLVTDSVTRHDWIRNSAIGDMIAPDR
ncbi:Polysaccharide pyruvyl transferase [Sphingobium sp. YR768]|nr:Polysaccharide pyruvyl transferase [Sphingobium sp. YR768]